MIDPREYPTAYLKDRPVLTRWQSRLLAVIGPLLVTAIALLIAESPFVQRLENVTVDWRFLIRGQRPPRDDILIIEIDEASRDELRVGDQRFDLRRHLPAAIENLIDAGALVVALDFWLADSTDEEVDSRLARTIAETDIVLAAVHTEGKLKRAIPPFLESQPYEGIINVAPDPDGVLRRLPDNLYLDVLDDQGGTARLPHFPLMVALYGLWEESPDLQIEFTDGEARLGSRTIAAGELINFTAPRGGGWSGFSFAEAVRGRFDSTMATGAIVLIGESRLITDSFTIPLAHSLNPGVYYHANVIAQILDGRRFEVSHSQGNRRTGWIASMGLLAGIFAWNQRRWWEHRRATLQLGLYLTTGVIVFIGGWLVLVWVMFSRDVVLPIVGPMMAMGLAMATGVAVQWLLLSANTKRLLERTRQIEALFGRSVSRSVLDALRSHPQQIVETQVRDVSVLFCDLRNFTALCAQLDPLTVARTLNEYFNHVTTAIFEEDGFLDKFVGDEIMAVFSVPLAQKDHGDRAVRAAIEIKKRLGTLNAIRSGRGELPLDCGIGIHTGRAAAGHIGSNERSNYTVVGDTVNLAARIEAFTTGGEIIISEACNKGLSENYNVSLWKTTEIRGLEGTHDLYVVSPG